MEKTSVHGINKITLRCPDNAVAPTWQTGVNAQLHFKVLTSPFRLVGDGQAVDEKNDNCIGNDNCSSNGNGNHQHSNGSACAAEKSQRHIFDASNRRLLSDTARDDGIDTPYELRMGKKFMWPAMETAVRTMKIGETSKFLLMPQHTDGYIQLESLLRRERQKYNAQAHGRPLPSAHSCCGAASGAVAETNSDLYATYGQPLELEITLLNVQMPHEFERQIWEMSVRERWNEALDKRDEGALKMKAITSSGIGNIDKPFHDNVNKKLLIDMRQLFERCFILVESVWTSSFGRDLQRSASELTDTNVESVPLLDKITNESQLTLPALSRMMMSARLNLCLVYLKLEEYNLVVHQATELLAMILVTSSQNNIACSKALYRRAVAYTSLGWLDKAEEDLLACLKNDCITRKDKDWAEAWKKLHHRQSEALGKERAMFGGIFASASNN